MELDPRIIVIIVVPDPNPEEASPLQGFALSLCSNSWMIRAASLIPSTIFDLTPQGNATLLARRLSGTNPVNWFGQTPRALRSQPISATTPFILVFLDDSQNVTEYREWVSQSEVVPTFIAKTGGDLSFSELDLEHLQRRFVQLCDGIPHTINGASVGRARQAIESWEAIPTRSLGYKVGGHNTVTPNLLVLESAGFDDMVHGRFRNVGENTEPYVDQIVKTTRSVLDLRESVGQRAIQQIFGKTFDINLFAPSMFPHVFSSQLPSDMGRAERQRFIVARNILERQTGYAYTSRTPAQLNAVMGEILENRTIDPHPLFQIRQKELTLATDCVGALAVSEVGAVLRLPNDVNRTSGSVRNFAAQYRGHSRATRKRLLGFHAVQNQLAAAVPSSFLHFISKSESGVRIIADAHLEWLDLEGLPLCIRKNVTRIPTTPGNSFVQALSAREQILLTPTAFKEVLIISAVAAGDPIRRALDIAINGFGRHWKDKLEIQIAEVSTEEELISAFNQFKGQLIIFDGHGGHEKDNAAKLFLRGTPIDIWSLRGKLVRIPPIIILSACDTHAADRNHATTANGFLALGATSVLASVFPLPVVDAAIFVARLLYRVSAYVPVINAVYGRSVAWNEVVSGMLRMQLLTDHLKYLLDIGVIDEKSYRKVHLRGNEAINGGEVSEPEAEPFDVVRGSLLSEGLNEMTIKATLEMSIANSTAISYLQLGRPETILINTAGNLAQVQEFFGGMQDGECRTDGSDANATGGMQDRRK